MKFINELREGEKISGIYLCKHKQPAVTKNGKPYENVILQDKTGTIDAKIWEPNSQGIDDFDTLDYIDVIGDVTSFQGSLQVSIKRARKAHEGEYEPGNYLPISEKSIDGMYEELLKYVHSIKNAYLNKLLVKFFEEDEEFIKTFKGNSAAKTVHHGFIGGLLEHTLGVVRLCQYYSKAYPVLNRDLLITAAMLHDIGKTVELSAFPMNDYTDDGQLLGHIPGFPAKLESELKHCILAHHGELEYGSPKKPALAEAAALNLADNTDAKMETITEIFRSAGDNKDWLGYNRFFESNLRKTQCGEE